MDRINAIMVGAFFVFVVLDSFQDYGRNSAERERAKQYENQILELTAELEKKTKELHALDLKIEAYEIIYHRPDSIDDLDQWLRDHYPGYFSD